MGTPDRGLLSFVARLPPPPASEGDGDLLARYAGAADEAAFAGIVQRHGQMVLAVCRRRLGHGADAEDAFQATFLALAWKAHALDRSGSLAGWLYRVAHLAALKAARQRARHPAGAPLPADVCDPDPPSAACEGHELRALIDAELAALPDKFRSVVVLCLVEGRTSAEAAAVLGVPVGTVDSRLSTARQKLRSRLARRGVAVGVPLLIEQTLGTPLGATDPAAVHELFATTIRAVLAEAARPGAGAVSPAVTHLARGVGTMMMSKLRFVVAVSAAFGVASASAAAYLAGAAPARQEAATERTPLDNPPQLKLPPALAAETIALRSEAPAAAPKPDGKEASNLKNPSRTFNRPWTWTRAISTTSRCSNCSRSSRSASASRS
ncbi:sigma-70 family rna polymerase sigma factor : RNA polymerase sigma factor, sigma-70 family OS=Singulisphaera acidiphila (strain ATCC BAA-1392 / DSM 18658 / VKM B-2454 / MOB10) GN=Sinac_0102 PE=4 SV=1: Sigma70_r2: Sigma70_r4_2 [Gemmataceae bacterium]|nr:sigma-70 family rna polymerase sigma factor : RNA polymerase sigma factor, sigma-70 family OS=Singulisphaera acidiphila (strain ATCC BAA-1392 / DSM 18658 / VKM B-2454 / MOB10) GN=Sinac_0102 PE=4 SV=1: Sigma70_r2: Sigma70_r4_2 [Gemmataceae bacterium]VTU00153.1 sigma-70 family rna polymerase sigma factor : RNA polymerase sigma factor, sigma-70 family OS=Singulisphaera acidiphila (strain ATCC BAA-1392 / DSM 18658 / VKM B-2454 / MOB10) GN=Sinac_0102 PE=4 SV=1: Sigma70_r2: Sigma70_r4_2 [Gemmataceae 